MRGLGSAGVFRAAGAGAAPPRLTAPPPPPALGDDYLFNMTRMRQWRFLMDNVPETISPKLNTLADVQVRPAAACCQGLHCRGAAGPCRTSRSILFPCLQTRIAVSRLQRIVLATWGFLGSEAGFVIPLSAIYLYLLLRAAAIERFDLFSIFLFVPRPAVLTLAK